MNKTLFIFKVAMITFMILALSGGNLRGKEAESCWCDLGDPDCAQTAAWQCINFGDETTGNFFPFSHGGYCFDENVCWGVITGFCEITSGGLTPRVTILCECPSAICYRPH